MKLSSVRLETKAIKTRYWEESTHRILEGKKTVGIVCVSDTKTTRAQMLAEFASSKQTINNLEKWSLPQQFTFMWVEVVKIEEPSRRRGYGTQIFDWIKETHRNTLIGLHPQEIAANYDISLILNFYRKQGFKISRFEYEWYGFLYLR
jgi:hypothetical protein